MAAVRARDVVVAPQGRGRRRPRRPPRRCRGVRARASSRRGTARSPAPRTAGSCVIARYISSHCASVGVGTASVARRRCSRGVPPPAPAIAASTSKRMAKSLSASPMPRAAVRNSLVIAVVGNGTSSCRPSSRARFMSFCIMFTSNHASSGCSSTNGPRYVDHRRRDHRAEEHLDRFLARDAALLGDQHRLAEREHLHGELEVRRDLDRHRRRRSGRRGRPSGRSPRARGGRGRRRPRRRRPSPPACPARA